MQKLIFILILVLISQITFAKNKHKKTIEIPPHSSQLVPQDNDLVKANELQKKTHFIEAKNLKVVRLLPDDTKGSPHQKFVVQLSNSRQITIISNLKLCEKIPVEVSDVISVGGEYIPTGKFAGLVHWTHFDPSKKRPNGYISMDDKLYCTSEK